MCIRDSICTVCLAAILFEYVLHCTLTYILAGPVSYTHLRSRDNLVIHVAVCSIILKQHFAPKAYI